MMKESYFENFFENPTCRILNTTNLVNVFFSLAIKRTIISYNTNQKSYNILLFKIFNVCMCSYYCMFDYNFLIFKKKYKKI